MGISAPLTAGSSRNSRDVVENDRTEAMPARTMIARTGSSRASDACFEGSRIAS